MSRIDVEACNCEFGPARVVPIEGGRVTILVLLLKFLRHIRSTKFVEFHQ